MGSPITGISCRLNPNPAADNAARISCDPKPAADNTTGISLDQQQPNSDALRPPTDISLQPVKQADET
ncbi:MAG: hypothetical protein P8176_04880, partial [Gammaproteobacteria bacterium]